MTSQTRIEGCEFCDEPSVGRFELTPPLYERGMQVKEAVKVHACAKHLESIETNRGWQDRERAKRRERRKALQAATDEAKLFDPGPARDVR